MSHKRGVPVPKTVINTQHISLLIHYNIQVTHTLNINIVIKYILMSMIDVSTEIKILPTYPKLNIVDYSSEHN
jgi:hypothetical protein